MSEKPITVLLVDDHAMLRSALANWLATTGDVQVAGSAKNAEEAIAEAGRLKPNVVLLDIDLSGDLAFGAARSIQAASKDSRIIFLSAFSHDRYIDNALACGAHGYVTKGEPLEAVAAAIRVVAQGGAYFSPDVESRVVIDTAGPTLVPEARSRLEVLTPRELEVLRYLARGFSKKEIATEMSLSVGTINNHAANMMKKLDVHDRVELTRLAIREGYVNA